MITFTHNACSICGINNIDAVSIFSDIEINKFLINVFSGSIDVDKLDNELYIKTTDELIKYFNKGWYSVNEVISESDTYELLIESLYFFSAAKQYQAVREINTIKKDNYPEFIEKAKIIFNKYYKIYFSAELDMCDIQGIASKKWISFTEWNELPDA